MSARLEGPAKGVACSQTGNNSSQVPPLQPDLAVVLPVGMTYVNNELSPQVIAPNKANEGWQTTQSETQVVFRLYIVRRLL